MEGAAIIAPIFLSQIVTLLSSLPAEPASLQKLLPLLGLFVLFSLLSWLGGRLEMGAGMMVIIKGSTALAEEAFEYLMRHSYQFFSSSFAGALTRRVNKYSGSFERLYFSLQGHLLPSFLFILGVIAVLFIKIPALGAVLFVWVVIFILVQWVMVRLQRPLRLARAKKDTELVGALADSISNQNTVLVFSGNAHENGLVGTAILRYEKAWQKLMMSDLLIYGIQGILSITINALLLGLAIFYWSKGVLTIGDIVLVQTYIIGLFNSVWGIGRELRNIYAAVADATEMVETLEKEHDIRDVQNAKPLAVSMGSIDFSNVKFGFTDGREVLNDFSLAIAPKEKIALVGPSGAGKTTVTKLLLRFYDLQGGRISIDEQNIHQVTQDSLRERVAFVPQEPILFHRTLMENIRYGRRNATEEEVIEAAKKAHCHEFISNLALGYNTFVGERGIKLSGGERQRVAIARAILKDAPILVLDEATSSLDSESESLIQDALNTLMQGKTVIVIAHRLSTIMKMDRIVVMEKGTVIAQGSHEELLAQEGLYKKLWSIQVGGFFGEMPAAKEEADEEKRLLLAEEREEQ